MQRTTRIEMQATAVRQRRENAPTASAAEARALAYYTQLQAAFCDHDRASDTGTFEARRAAVLAAEAAWTRAYDDLARALNIAI